MNNTKIGLYSGHDPASTVPKFVRKAELSYRLAVVQDTYRADSVDMYFDEALWNRLLEFATSYNPRLTVGVVDRPGKRRGREPKLADELLLGSFKAIRAAEPADQHPAEYIMVRDDGRLLLCIVTEFWTQVGGPLPYADSYTYAIFSKHDLAGRVLQFLTASTAASGWLLPAQVCEISKSK
jgi:hypothetical protein